MLLWAIAMKQTFLIVACALWFPAFEQARGDPFLEWYADTEIQKLKGYGFHDDAEQIKKLKALKAEKNHEEAKEKLISYLLLGPSLDPRIKFYLMSARPLKAMERDDLLAARNQLVSKLNELMMNNRITLIEISPEEIKFRLRADRWPPFKEVDWMHDWEFSVIASELR